MMLSEVSPEYKNGPTLRNQIWSLFSQYYQTELSISWMSNFFAAKFHLVLFEPNKLKTTMYTFLSSINPPPPDCQFVHVVIQPQNSCGNFIKWASCLKSNIPIMLDIALRQNYTRSDNYIELYVTQVTTDSWFKTNSCLTKPSNPGGYWP